MTLTVEALVQDVGELVSLPEVCVRINRMVDDPEVAAAELGTAISQDPAITAKLLRVANSALYGFSSTIETTARAVAVLGREKVRELVLASSATRAFEGLPNELVSMDHFWRHSLFCALAARHLGRRCKSCGEPDVLFTAGLLHDIGELVLFARMADKAREALFYSIEGPGEPEIHVAEREIIGFDHAEVGGALARLWQLPPVLAQCIEFHHHPVDAPDHATAAAVIHIANTIAYWAELDTTDEEAAPRIDPAAWELTGLAPEVIGPAVEEARTLIAEIEALFFSGD